MLTVNSVIKYLDDDREERILRVDEEIDEVILININNNDMPSRKSLSELEEEVKANRVIINIEEKYFLFIKEEDIGVRDKAIRDKAWHTIKDIVNSKYDIFDPSTRGTIINYISVENNIHRNTIVKYLKRFWKRGCIKNALLPDYFKCGGSGKEKQCSSKKRGRKRNNRELGEGINVDEGVKKIFKSSINKYYYNSTRKSLTLTYQLMIRDYYSESYINNQGKTSYRIYTKDKIPSLNQFIYWFNKERNIKKEVSTRVSTRKYEQVSRGILGTSVKRMSGPNTICQIDATIADIYIKSSFDNSIIGRPTIYAVVDVFSRAITGVYIGLESPSWIGAMMALANCATDKVKFCAEYGLEIEKNQWEMETLPERLLGDRGELLSQNVEGIINSLGVKIQNTKPYAGQMKGIVEQYFNTINNRMIKPLLPGSVDLNSIERGDRDYRLDAKLTIREFTVIIIKLILHHNSHHLLNEYNKDEMMIEDNVAAIPSELWRWGIENRMGALRKIDENIVKLNLLPRDVATITQKGIKFKGIFYSSKNAMKERWFEKARNSGWWKINICYDPRDLKSIYILSKDSRSYERCFLLEHQQKYKNKSIEELNYLMAKESNNNERTKYEELNSTINLISEIEDIIESIDDKDIVDSDRKRLIDIRENRDKERMANREFETFTLKGINDNSTAQDIERNNEVDIEQKREISVLKRKQRDMMGVLNEKNSNT